MVSIRRVRDGDAELLRTVRLAALAESPSAFGKTLAEEAAYPSSYWVETAQARAAGNVITTLIALDDAGEPLGLIGGYRPEFSGPVELVSMWVAPSRRGAGIGRDLVDRLLVWARDTGAEAVELGVTRGNDGAINLYRACGFELTGERAPLASDTSLDELRMRLPLRHEHQSGGGRPG